MVNGYTKPQPSLGPALVSMKLQHTHRHFVHITYPSSNHASVAYHVWLREAWHPHTGLEQLEMADSPVFLEMINVGGRLSLIHHIQPEKIPIHIHE